MQGSNDAAEVMGIFQETASRKTAENTVKHCDGGVGSLVANHRHRGGCNNTIDDNLVNHPLKAGNACQA